MSLVTILILLIIAALVWYLITLLPIDPRFKRIIEIVAILILIVILLQQAGLLTGVRVT